SRLPAGSAKRMSSLTRRASANAFVPRSTRTPAASSRAAFQRRGVRDLPVEEADPFGGVRLDQEPLAAVVHAQPQRRPAGLDELHAQKFFAKTRPILEVAGAQPDVAERLQLHSGPGIPVLQSLLIATVRPR